MRIVTCARAGTARHNSSRSDKRSCERKFPICSSANSRASCPHRADKILGTLKQARMHKPCVSNVHIERACSFARANDPLAGGRNNTRTRAHARTKLLHRTPVTNARANTDATATQNSSSRSTSARMNARVLHRRLVMLATVVVVALPQLLAPRKHSPHLGPLTKLAPRWPVRTRDSRSICV